MATISRKVMTSQQNILRSPAAERNKQPLLKVLSDVIPSSDNVQVLEIASEDIAKGLKQMLTQVYAHQHGATYKYAVRGSSSLKSQYYKTIREGTQGTGQHACFFAEHLPNITWQPSEIDNNSINSIQGYIKTTEVTNVRDPVFVNTTHPVREWASGTLEPGSYDVILCVNMTHISEWASTEGLFGGSSVYLKPRGVLLAYGPYKQHGKITPQSNVQFDLMLRQQNSEWGLRDLEDLEKLAKSNGMVLEKIFDMPANNKTAMFRKLE